MHPHLSQSEGARMQCGRSGDDRHLDIFGDFRAERMCSCFLVKLGVVIEEAPELPSSRKYNVQLRIAQLLLREIQRQAE